MATDWSELFSAPRSGTEQSLGLSLWWCYDMVQDLLARLEEMQRTREYELCQTSYPTGKSRLLPTRHCCLAELHHARPTYVHVSALARVVANAGADPSGGAESPLGSVSQPVSCELNTQAKG